MFIRNWTPIIVLSLSVALSAPSKADTVNVCAELAERVFVPAYSKMEKECEWSTAECVTGIALGFPNAILCCTDGCFVDPLCWSWKTVEVVAQWIESDELFCDFSAEQFVEHWLQGHIANMFDLLAAGLPEIILDALEAHIDTIAARGHPFPGHVRTLLKELVEPVYDHGQTGFSYSDIDNIKIISKADEQASWYFTDDYGAVTLGPVVVFTASNYDILVDPENTYTYEDIQYGNVPWSYLHAIELCAHELVHVAQFRGTGRDEFHLVYLIDYLVNGYRNNSFEDEAYSFSAILSLAAGGEYCEATAYHHRDKITERGLGIDYDECTPWEKRTFAAILSTFFLL